MPWLINASQLEKFRKNQKNIVIFDVSWHLAEDERNAKQEFIERHLPGARFLDLNDFHDTSSPLPNMLIRNEDLINEKLNAHGITNDHKIMFYDHSKFHTSCRALWMFKVFGHNPHLLYILDGGLEGWVKSGGKIETGETKNTLSKNYKVTFEAHFIRTLVQMKTNLHHPSEQVIDMRHAVRFAGGKEHRENLRSGHIPGSYSFPYTTMFEDDGRFKPVEKIKSQLKGCGLDITHPIITTCGSGISAAILNFALELIDDTIPQSLYDGSWAEWGATELYHGESGLEERPVVTSLES